MSTHASHAITRHVVTLTFGLLLVAGARAALPAAGVQVAVVEDTGDRIVLEYEFGPFIETPVAIDGVKYAQLLLPGEPPLETAGAPALPHVARSVAIPWDAVMAVSVTGDCVEYAGVDAAPSKGVLTRDVNPDDVPFVFDEAVYGADAFFPGPLATLSEPYILRDVRGQVVDVFPLQYNPATRVLRYYPALTVELRRVGTAGPSVPLTPRMQRPSASFERIYAGQFLNYAPSLRYPGLDEEGALLIICHDAWLSNIAPLADHKNAIGIDTTVVPVSQIGNNATAIRNYIQSVYSTSNLAFVLLVGDAAQVASPLVSGGEADPTYAKVAGPDNYPDIFVGRFSAETAAQVDTQVARTIAFESGYATTQPWFWQAVGVASAEGGGSLGDDGESDRTHMDNIRADLLAAPYTLVDRVYDPGASASTLTAALNAGRGLINYAGHGNSTGWGTTSYSISHVNGLQNVGKLPVVISVACSVGDFGGQTCFAESWLRATHDGAPTGAVAVYMSSILQSWNSPMCAQDEIVDRYCAEDYVTYGALCFAGSCQMMDEYGSDGVNMFNTWNLFGDPSLRIVGVAVPPSGLWVQERAEFYATGEAGGPFTPDSAVYTLENRGESPLAYAVTTDATWLTLENASGVLPGQGTAAVTVALNSAAAALGNGLYTSTLGFHNLTDGQGDTERTAALKVGLPSVQYEWTMDVDPGWTCEGDWAWGRPVGLGGDHGGPDPTSGYTGTYVYGYNLAGGYANNMPELHLTSGPIDCAALGETRVAFRRWLGVERSTYDKAGFRVSNDGVTWVDLWANSTTVDDGAWVYQEFDIAALADGQPTVYLRWTMGRTDLSWTYCGWNIDDVQIIALRRGDEQPPRLGDTNCDGQVDFFDIDAFLVALGGQAAYEARYPDCRWLNADCNEDGNVDFFDIDAFVGTLGN